MDMRSIEPSGEKPTGPAFIVAGVVGAIFMLSCCFCCWPDTKENANGTTPNEVLVEESASAEEKIATIQRLLESDNLPAAEKLLSEFESTGEHPEQVRTLRDNYEERKRTRVQRHLEAHNQAIAAKVKAAGESKDFATMARLTRQFRKMDDEAIEAHVSPFKDALLEQLQQTTESLASKKPRDVVERYKLANECHDLASESAPAFSSKETREAIAALKQTCIEHKTSLAGPQKALMGLDARLLEWKWAGQGRVSGDRWSRTAFGTCVLHALPDKKGKIRVVYIHAVPRDTGALTRTCAANFLGEALGVEISPEYFEPPKGTYIRHTKRKVPGSRHKATLGFHDDTLVEITVGRLPLSIPKSER